MAYKVAEHQLPGLLVLEGRSFPDERGFFMESFRASDAAEAGLPPLVQDNLSRSTKGVLRGLHYQIHPAPIGKLVRCVRGRIFDVAVDIRKGSPTYGKWASIELSDEGNRMFWIPEGFAHGFYTISDTADVMYKVSGYWSPAVDRGILWNDPAVGVAWPARNPVVAAKDAQMPPLARAENTFTFK